MPGRRMTKCGPFDEPFDQPGASSGQATPGGAPAPAFTRRQEWPGREAADSSGGRPFPAPPEVFSGATAGSMFGFGLVSAEFRGGAGGRLACASRPLSGCHGRVWTVTRPRPH